MKQTKINKQKMYIKKNTILRHWTSDNEVIPWEKGNKCDGPCDCPQLITGDFPATVQGEGSLVEMGRLQELRKWSWECKRPKVAGLQRTEYQRCTERELWRSPEGSPPASSRVLIRACIWANCPRLREKPPKRIIRNSSWGSHQPEKSACFHSQTGKSLNSQGNG